MTPRPLEDLRRHVERTQAGIEDPAERDRALAVVERDMRDLLGLVTTYRNDARLQTEGAEPEHSSDGPPDAAEKPADSG